MPPAPHPEVTHTPPVPRPRSEYQPDAGRLLAAAVEAGDWVAAADIIDRQWTSLTVSPEQRTVIVEAVSSIPVDLLASRPKVAFMAEGLGRPAVVADVDLPSTPAEVDAVLRAGEARELVAQSLHLIYARQAAGRLGDAWTHVNAALPLVKAATASPLSPATSIAAHWYLHAGQVGLLAGDFFAGHRLLSIAWSYRGSDCIGNAEIMIAPNLALANSLLGDWEHVEEWSTVVDEYAARSESVADWDNLSRTRATAMLLTATDRLDIEGGVPWFEQLVDGSRFDIFWPASLVGVVRHLISLGQADRAARQIATTAELHSASLLPGSVHRGTLAMARADLALVLGRANEVAANLAHMADPPYPIVAALYAARLALGAGDYSRARQLTLNAETNATAERARREASVIRAAAELAMGNREEAARLVRLPGTFAPQQRRTLALLPADLNQRMRDELGLGDELPPTNPLLAQSGLPRAIHLTAAERRVLEALATPVSLDKVAETLFITRNTLKSHTRSLYGKLGATSRDEAVALANELGLL